MYADDAVSTDADDPILAVFSQACADDPHPVYHDMHDRCPVSRDPGMFGGYSVTLSESAADAPHKDAALAFINFVLQPASMAAIANATRYPNAVPDSRPMIRPELMADRNVFPTDADVAGFFTIGPVPQAAERARTRLWARFKAGS